MCQAFSRLLFSEKCYTINVSQSPEYATEIDINFCVSVFVNVNHYVVQVHERIDVG